MRDFAYPARLKPDTPWQIRREIRKKEMQAERLCRRIYQLGVLAELLIIGMLLMCVTHYGITYVLG